MSDDNSTVVITDIHKTLLESDSQAKDLPACLVGQGAPINGTLFDLPESGTLIVGRTPSNDICLDYQGISRTHFEIHIEQEKVMIKDLNSSNGTFINNKQVQEETLLTKGDIIKIGAVALKYLPKGDMERVTYDNLHREASTDGLTQCYNKTYFNDQLDKEFKKSKSTGQPLSLIIFDLDHFKKLNDNFGHDAGDYVLKELANLLRNNGIRGQDVFARYGGEEFVVLSPGTNLKQSFEMAERLRKLIEDHVFSYDNQRLPVTASIGVADYREGVNEAVDLFKRADQAVYTSKGNGRNQVNFFKP